MQELKQLNSAAPEHGPDFQRLQVYADIFDELIECSPTFHFVLQNVKVILMHVYISCTICRIKTFI